MANNNRFCPLAVVALAFEVAYFTFFFTAQIEGEQCTGLIGQPATCGRIDNSGNDFKVIDVAIGRDVENPLTMTKVEIPPAGPILNAFAWCATSLVIGVVMTIIHLVPSCRAPPKVLLSLAVLNLVTVCPAFSYLATFSYTSDGLRSELSPSFTWGPGMNLGALVALFTLVVYDITLLKAPPAASSTAKNVVDIEANSGNAPEAAATKPKPNAAAKGKKATAASAKKPAPKYNADAVSAA